MARRRHFSSRTCRRYSRDLKQRIIYQAHVLGQTTTSIAISLDMPLRVVQRVLKTYCETGEVVNERKMDGRIPLMSETAVEFMLALLEHSPDLYLEEIQQQLLLLHNIEVSIATIWRTLKHLGLSSKKLSQIASERSEEAHREFTMAIGEDSPDHIVCIDESAVNVLMMFRLNGWSHSSMQAHKHCNFIRGTRYVFSI
ncbi:hypothetical protein BKA82DRAFT_171143 [Pisolithus tinctorius]|uniref:Winged helix-turn helix domain-containing protein n=1 Tax=Pisolithus tinctorius Marx 270 TaxID=870435 RepID=A0A0C3ND16_PISTI|nr:hypothetical protein BKA82DRAFT_171143 [Pisolithus tinctorius]KIN93468.1 hypothetical protein M404DRAFT_171143 [Pisolithus tinctorius Marx 270]